MIVQVVGICTSTANQDAPTITHRKCRNAPIIHVRVIAQLKGTCTHTANKSVPINFNRAIEH